MTSHDEGRAAFESLVDHNSNHPAVLDGSITAEELAVRLIEYLEFWKIVHANTT